MLTLIALVYLSSSSFALDVHAIEAAINSNEPAKVHQLLSEENKPFKRSWVDRLDDRADQYSNVEKAGPFLIFKSIEAKPNCNAKIVSELVERGASVEVKHLKMAGERLCDVEAAKVLASKLTQDEISTTSIEYFNFFKQNFLHLSIDDEQAHKDVVSRAIDWLKFYSENAKADCPKLNDSKSCAFIHLVNQTKADMDQSEKEQNYAQSPAGIADEICEKRAQIEQYQARINHEKKIGQTAGFVNAEVLHDAGSELIRSKEELSDLERKFKTKSKKSAGTIRCVRSDG